MIQHLIKKIDHELEQKIGKILGQVAAKQIGELWEQMMNFDIQDITSFRRIFEEEIEQWTLTCDYKNEALELINVITSYIPYYFSCEWKQYMMDTFLQRQNQVCLYNY